MPRTTKSRFTLTEYADLDSWLTRRRELIDHVATVAGVDPAWPRPHGAPILGPLLQGDGFTVQAVWLETLPGFYLGGNLLRPAAAGGRRPAVLNPHGHARLGRLHHDENFATLLRCATLARLGYVAFAWDMLSYGDTAQLPHAFDERALKLYGLTPLGIQLHNSLAAFDYVAGLPDVDPERIACTGESGGATQTLMLTAVQPKLAAAAPVCMISAHFQGGCVCEHAPSLRTETYNVEIAALAAPRPLLVVSTGGDWTNETPDVELPDLKRLYALYGAADRVEGFHQEAPHNYNAASRRAVYAWLRRVLPAQGDDGAPLAEPDLTAETVASWRCDPALLPADRLEGDALLHHLKGIVRALPPSGPAEARLRLAHLTGVWSLSRHTSAAHPQRGTLVVHPADRNPEAQAFATKLHAAGAECALVALEPGEEAEGMLAEGFVDSAAARLVQAVLREADQLGAAAVVGIGAAGPICALAAPFLAGVAALACELDDFAPDDENAYLDRLYVPGLLRAGGLGAALGAALPATYVFGSGAAPLPPNVERGDPADAVKWLQARLQARNDGPAA